MSGTREATHAGSWYSSSRSKLAEELSKNLAKVTPLPDLEYEPPLLNSKAIIAPYSGPTAAWAYASLPVDRVKRIFLLGPSHHAYLPGVALSPFAKYSTPLGDIPLCLDTIEELNKTEIFSRMKKSVDEDEHSLEMHLPYIRHIFQGREDLRLVPILVGHASEETETKLSQVLEPYFRNPETYFIVSSDFCHWGTRFSCTPYYPDPPPPPSPVPPVAQHTHIPSNGQPELIKRFSPSVSQKETPIWKSIEYMDHEGMDLLREPGAEGAVEKWEAYLARTKNTICGRNPITVLLQLLTHIARQDGSSDYEFAFVRYEQSSKCLTGGDSSVSYVSGILRPKA